jgi:uncharacterized protein (DUF1697 family)
MSTCIALLRGINVGGHNKIPMAELRALCEGIGLRNVQSYIQSGNLVFLATESPQRIEDRIEQAIEKTFGLKITVLVRTAAEWPEYRKKNPLAAACEKEPNLVMLALSKEPPRSDAVASLRERAAADERIEAGAGAIWIHYGSGMGRSKLSPALLDKLVGSPVTTRNWRTILKLAELAGVPA